MRWLNAVVELAKDATKLANKSCWLSSLLIYCDVTTRSGSTPGGPAIGRTTSGDVSLRHLWRFTHAAWLPGDGHVVAAQQAIIRHWSTRACLISYRRHYRQYSTPGLASQENTSRPRTVQYTRHCKLCKVAVGNITTNSFKMYNMIMLIKHTEEKSNQTDQKTDLNFLLNFHVLKYR